MPYVNYIEFNVPDSKQAAEFFKQVFGWDAQGWGEGDYMVVSHGEEPGIDTGIDKMQEDDRPSAVPVVTVESVDKAVKDVEAAGGKIVVPKMAIPGMGYAAYFTTPGGLLMSVNEGEEAAA